MDILYLRGRFENSKLINKKLLIVMYDLKVNLVIRGLVMWSSHAKGDKLVTHQCNHLHLVLNQANIELK